MPERQDAAILSRFNVVAIDRALRAAKREPRFPPISDRKSWEEVRLALPHVERAALFSKAREAARSPVPSLPATLYLEFARTGERDGYEQFCWERRKGLAALTLAECLEDRGRFRDPLLDWAWAICEESSWAMPAHQSTLADVQRPYLDLGVAMTAIEMAECVELVGERLDPALTKRVHAEVDRRCLTPFLTRHDFWWMHGADSSPVNNWTGVCVGGIVSAACYLEADPARLAELVARGLRSLQDYLATFDEDGGSSEGPGYWSYGFGFYTITADLIEWRTGGEVRILDGERLRDIARYPMRTLLNGRRFVNFSDCDRDVELNGPLLAYLARRVDIPELMGLAAQQPAIWPPDQLTWGLRRLFWRPDAESTPPIPAKCDFFHGMHWMLARYDPVNSDALVLATKGGHNDEMHNQNDVGAYLVQWRDEPLIADPGRGRYTRAYFGPERYDHLVNSSFGHSVPVVNGHGQATGRRYTAQLMEYRVDGDADLLTLDLRDAYPDEAGLATLRRTLVLHREPPNGWVSLEDVATFGVEPGMFATVLITFAKAAIKDGDVQIEGERGALNISAEEGDVRWSIEEIPDVDLAKGPAMLTRVVGTLSAPTSAAMIRLRIEPVA